MMTAKFLRRIVCLVLLAALLTVSVFFAFADGEVVKIYTVNVNGARIRDDDREVITTLPKGTKVLYMNNKVGATSRVRVSNALEGYIYDEFLDYYGAVKLDNLYYCTAGTKSVYRTASENETRVGSIVADQYVVVLRVRGNWGFVKNLQGKGGFCTLDNLVKAI